MKLFLCSHFSSVGSLIKEEIENKKVAFIPTASLREGYTGYVGSARKLFKKLGAIVTEIDISTEAYSTIQSVFEDADVIYFTGGNSFFLMDQLRKTGTDGLLKKELANGKLMIGESAGAIICAPSIQYIEQMDEKPEDYSQEDDAGLDLIDFYVLPHYLMLADMLQDALDTALGQYTLSLAELPRQAADRAELREKITSRKQEIQRLRGIVRSLYENLVQGVLTKDEYFDYKEKYESRITDLSVEMEQLEDGLRTMDTQIEQHRALEQDAAQIKTDRALTGALIERLIDRIEVSHDKQITVRYRFQSEFETYAEVLEQCRNM